VGEGEGVAGPVVGGVGGWWAELAGEPGWWVVVEAMGGLVELPGEGGVDEPESLVQWGLRCGWGGRDGVEQRPAFGVEGGGRVVGEVVGCRGVECSPDVRRQVGGRCLTRWVGGVVGGEGGDAVVPDVAVGWRVGRGPMWSRRTGGTVVGAVVAMAVW
jgi:hypothetical protein